VEQSGVPGGEAQPGSQGPGATVVAPARPAGPRFFTGSFDHSVDPKHRLVLPATFRPRLADGAYLGPLDGFLGLWPEEEFGNVLARWEDGLGLGIVSEEVFDAFTAATFHVMPDTQGRIVVHKDLRSFADIDGPVMVVGARQRIAVWARDRWDRRQESIPDGPHDALRQAAKDLKL
jgi:transcriptional regulator MraZ